MIILPSAKKSKIINKYDSEGNLVSTVAQSDWNGDGVIDSSSSTTNKYNSEGNLVSTVVQSDWNGDGVIDSIY